MGFLRQRTRLEKVALVVLVGTIATIVVVASGLLRDDATRTAQRVTVACRPLAEPITPGTAPASVTAREVANLRLEMARVAEALQPIAKDARDEARSGVLRMIDRMEFAADEFSAVMSVRQRAETLTGVAALAASLGASCPSPLTGAQGAAIDRARAESQSQSRAERAQGR